tara:strand:- start:138 stop:314 length:177 start_codon:yes stop_codon:yes gene_type:complete
MDIVITKKFKENYDNNPFKPKPMRPFGGRLNREDAIKMKQIKSNNNIRKDGKYHLNFK